MNNASFESATTNAPNNLGFSDPGMEEVASGTDKTPSALQRPDKASWNPEQQLDPSEYAVLQIFEALVKLGRGEIDVNTLLVGKPEGVRYRADVGDAEEELENAYADHQAPVYYERIVEGEVTLKVIFVPVLPGEGSLNQMQHLDQDQHHEIYARFGADDYKFYSNPDYIYMQANYDLDSLAGTEKIWPTLFDAIQFPILVTDRQGFKYANPAYKVEFSGDIQ